MSVMPKLLERNAEKSAENELILRALAIELVRNIDDPEEILERFHLTGDEYQSLADTRAFKLMLEQAVKEWSTTSTAERIKIKAANVVETALPAMFAELGDKTNPLSSRADLLGRIAKIGGLGESRQGDTGSKEMFSININIGAERPITVQPQLIPRVIEHSDFEEA